MDVQAGTDREKDSDVYRGASRQILNRFDVRRQNAYVG